MAFAATFISVLAWLQVFMRWLFEDGRNSTQDITGPDVAYKGSRPNPPSAVAVVWAEDKLRDSAIKQLVDIIQWCDHDGLETLCVYDPSGDLKSKTFQLQHELSNQDWSIQVGWRAEPIGQELTCDACRAGEQGVAAATSGAASPSAPSTSATLRACADATTSHPGPSSSRAPPPPAASAAPTASCKTAADPAAAAAAAAALPLQKARPATAASCGCRQQPAASVAPCSGGGFVPDAGGAPAGCSPVGCDAPSHGCVTAAASPASVVAEVPALAAGAAAVVAAAADCGCRQPLQSIRCTSGGGAGCSLCRLPSPPPLAAAASCDLSWRAGAAGGGASGGEQPQPGHPPHQATNGAAGAVAGATDCRLRCAGDLGSALTADTAAAATAATAGTAAGPGATCAVGQATTAAGALGCPHHGGLNGQALLEPSGAGGQECCARRSPADRLSSVGPSGGYDEPPPPAAAAAAARCGTGTSTAVDRSTDGDGCSTAGPAEAAAGGAGGTGAAARRVRRLHVLSAEDGYAPVLRAAAAGGVCCRCGAVMPLKAGPYREGLARLRNQMAQLAGPAVLVQPDLVLVVGPVLSLAGFSPLAVATSEILHLGPAVGMCRARVDVALAKFLRTEQRFGS